MKIKHSLSLKVFIVTFILQLLTGVLICGLLYAFVPESVSREERDEKEASFYSFVDDLNSVALEDSGDIIDAYILSEDVSVVFYRGTRLEFSTPIVATPSKYAALTSLEVNRYYDSLPEDAEMFISSSEIRFIDQDTDFLVVVTGAYSEDSVIPAAIVKCLPIIIPILILISEVLLSRAPGLKLVLIALQGLQGFLITLDASIANVLSYILRIISLTIGLIASDTPFHTHYAVVSKVRIRVKLFTN